jgi:tRNA threonylcarbamoyladenosine biosynthesis protein TsaB
MDSSFDPSGIALADDGGIVASLTFRYDRDFSRWWATRLQWLLSQAGWKMSDLDGFAVCDGPGSFTGLRISVSAAKTMAQALGKPILGISSLELLALPYRSTWVGPIVSLLYCRKGEAYRAVFDANGETIREPAVLTVEEVNAELSVMDAPLICGDAGKSNALVLPPSARRSDPWLWLPHIEVLAREGHRRLAEGKGADPMGITIRYLKRSQVEEMMAEKRRHEAENAAPVAGESS